jgi:hypothetical protein
MILVKTIMAKDIEAVSEVIRRRFIFLIIPSVDILSD